MKQLTFIIATLILAFTASAEKGHGAAKMAAKGNLEVKFHSNVAADVVKDSVLVIFDRFDHTGAGVVYQVFYPNADNSITIPAVAEGKYYVTIQCLGLHHDRIETVVKIKSEKSEILKIDQQDSQVFNKGNVVIPETHVNLMNLSIVSSK